MTMKILLLLFCITPVAQSFFAADSAEQLLNLNLAKTFIFFGIISIVTLFWLLINYKFKHKNLRIVIELSVMMLFGGLCYGFTGLAASGYKFVFVLIVTIYSMELGRRAGAILSTIAGAIILVGDFLSTTSISQRSPYFQADFMLIATFFFVSYIVGFYVEKTRKLITTLEESSNRDALTGLFNHRYFHQRLRDLMDSEADEPQFLFMADIDYFKVYNDTLGHPKGDVVLKEISSICTEAIPDGLVARYGGEEFAFVVSAPSAQEAYAIGNRVRESILNHHFEGEEMMPGRKITVSIGVAERKGAGDTVADWLARADNALYKAKSFRKNRVELYASVYDRFDHLDQIQDDERIISIKTILSIIDTRDHYTYNHTDRVVHYCETYAKYAKLSEEDSRKLLYGAYLHDIGKINVAKETLITEKRLSDAQWEEIRKHPADGAEIVRKIQGFEEIAEIVLQHHEKYDGTGYPNRVMGEDLHYLARVLTLADSFDAMTAKRPYQKVKTFEEAIIEIRRCCGTQFDPAIAELFIRAIEETYC